MLRVWTAATLLALLWMILSFVTNAHDKAVLSTWIAASMAPKDRLKLKNIGIGVFLLPQIVFFVTCSILCIFSALLFAYCTVNYSMKLSHVMYCARVVFGVVGAVSLIIDFAYFAGSYWFVYVVVVIEHGLITSLMIHLTTRHFQLLRDLYSVVLTYHNFLIEYRQTPVQKYRRHLPTMDVIYEVESAYEQSQIAKSRSSCESSKTPDRASRMFLLDQSAERELYSDDEYESDLQILGRLSGMSDVSV